MAPTKKDSTQRIDIPFFEGVNSLVGYTIAKKHEFAESENARSKKIGIIEKRQGFKLLGNDISSTANFGLAFFDDDVGASKDLYRVSTVSTTTKIYYLNTSDVWTALSDDDATVSAARCEFAVAEGSLFVVNGTDQNRYIQGSDHAVIRSSDAGHLVNSPKANKINYYKDRLYLGDYTDSGDIRYKTGIMRSSNPLGIVALVDGDHASGVTTINVTDAKYIASADSLDVYRGGTKIETIAVSAKTETTITVTATSNAINSADELWVADTFTGTKLFRWADNARSGEDVKQYDTFKISGGQNDPLRMVTNIGDVMMIANKHNFSVWNDYSLENFDLGIGCASNDGWVKHLGVLFFTHHSGIYATTGGRPKLISSKVQRYIDGANANDISNIENVSMGRRDMSIYAHIGSVDLFKEDGSVDKTLSNVVLEYNLRQENWFPHIDIPADRFATYYASDNVDRLQFQHDTNFEIYEIMRDDDDWYKDGDDSSSTEIPFVITTHPINLSKNFEDILYPTEILVDVERGSDIICFIALDNGQFYELPGKISKGANRIRVKPRANIEESLVRCRKIRVSLREFSKRGVKISRIAIKYKTSVEVEEHRS